MLDAGALARAALYTRRQVGSTKKCTSGQESFSGHSQQKLKFPLDVPILRAYSVVVGQGRGSASATPKRARFEMQDYREPLQFAKPQAGSYYGERCVVVAEYEDFVVLRHADMSTHGYEWSQIEFCS